METAEVKSKKRIRHSYPRQEVYHRWIHDETLVYHNQHIPCWGKYDWLFAGGCPARKATKEDIVEAWGYHKAHCIAVIDRCEKRVLINISWKKHWWGVKNAIPDNYEIFLTDKNIPTANILTDDEALFKLHITYLIEQFTNDYLGTFYNTLANRIKFPYYAYENLFDYRAYKDIVDFVKKHKLRKYSWCKVSLNEKFKIRSSNKEWWKFEVQPIPSINKIIKGNIFTKKEILLLNQKYFYKKYCYGNGIPFKDVVENWNKPIYIDEAVSYLRAHNNYCVFTEDTYCTTWNDYIKKAVTAERIYLQNKEKENRDKSQQNYLKALAERDKLINEVYTINDWREGKHIPSTDGKGVTYRKYVPYSKRTGPGHWVDDIVPFNFYCLFSNIQLRLTKDRKRIETSKGATVPYNAAKEFWRKFIIWINSNNVAKDPCFNFEDKNIKVGIYTLYFIKYCTKYTDSRLLCYNNKGESISDWLIQIGCHSIWLTDVLDFIKYYKLEKDFSIEFAINPRVKPSIKTK